MERRRSVSSRECQETSVGSASTISMSRVFLLGGVGRLHQTQASFPLSLRLACALHNAEGWKGFSGALSANESAIG